MALENELKKKNVTPQTLGEEHRKAKKNPLYHLRCYVVHLAPPQAIDFSFYCLKESGGENGNSQQLLLMMWRKYYG
jgi:hypothetical protein